MKMEGIPDTLKQVVSSKWSEWKKEESHRGGYSERVKGFNNEVGGCK